MRIVNQLSALSIGSLLSLAPLADAHHSAAPFYDLSETVFVEGIVTRVRWQNPHIIVELQDADQEQWTIEGVAINSLERLGVESDTISAGDLVSVAGPPSRRLNNRMLGAVLTFQDGRKILLDGGIAAQLGLIEPIANVTDTAQSGNEPASVANDVRGIFRVWTRSSGGAAQGYPQPPESGLKFTRLAISAQQAWDPLTDDTGLRCIPQGMPGVIINPYPIEFVDRGDVYELRIEEWDTVRTIHMDEDSSTEALATALGYSVGRWEDSNTLVVTTTRISWPYFDDIGTPKSEEMIVTERFTLSDDESRLDYEQTVVDPLILLEPAVLTGYFWWQPGEVVKPFNCTLADGQHE